MFIQLEQDLVPIIDYELFEIILLTIYIYHLELAVIVTLYIYIYILFTLFK